ncbi:MAG: hypothetical protein M9930_22620 [Anaerolineae bacterium]|nr:hypothetical protein [Anaerolineae bacterium]
MTTPLILKRTQAAIHAHRFPDLRFWIGFFLLNTLLFLPTYLFNRLDTHLLPSAGDDWVTTWFVWRNNLDVLRLHVEWVAVVALWITFGRMRRGRLGRWFRAVTLALYLIAVIYAVYEASMRAMYQLDPNFYGQLPLFRDGIEFVLVSLQIPAWVYVAATVALIVVVWVLARLYLAVISPEAARLSVWTRGGIWLLLGWGVVVAFMLGGRLASPKTAVNSLTVKLVQNITASAELYRQVQSFDPSQPQAVYDFTDQILLRKPNIYLIFVESYGSVLYKRDDWRERYTDMMTAYTARLAADGWYAATALSESPTWGGGSWMAYTSALFGLRIDSQPQYLALFEAYQEEAYPDFGHYLQDQGYNYTRLSSIVSDLEDVDWGAYEQFYGTDRWLNFDDLAYDGPVYGWGPAPPDQYALNFVRENVMTKSAEPQLLFFITQNSHYPWAPLPQIVKDYRAYLTGEFGQVVTDFDPTALPNVRMRENYMQSIEYEMTVLFDFIRETGDEDALFVLIGDHQPQRVSKRLDGFDTPLHILSRDPALIDALGTYGLEPGLLVAEPEPALHHEGLYSLLMNLLLGEYGSGVKVPPPYRPNGMTMQDDIQ